MFEISGFIQMADIELNFECAGDKCTYSVVDVGTGDTSRKTVNKAAFLKALSIAVHSDGTPNYESDYPDAESVMPDRDNTHLRWIP